MLFGPGVSCPGEKGAQRRPGVGGTYVLSSVVNSCLDVFILPGGIGAARGLIQAGGDGLQL